MPMIWPLFRIRRFRTVHEVHTSNFRVSTLRRRQRREREGQVTCRSLQIQAFKTEYCALCSCLASAQNDEIINPLRTRLDTKALLPH